MGWTCSSGAEYAEHARIGGKPRLQWTTGDKLDEVRIQLVFHASYCDPEQEFVKLHTAMRSREARQFVLGNGTYKGWFVVTELSGASRQTDARGALVAMDASVTLREYAEKASITPPRDAGSEAGQAAPSVCRGSGRSCQAAGAEA